MSAAKITSDGKATQLDGRGQPVEPITESDIQDVKKLSKFLTSLSGSVSTLLRRWNPNRIDFEDMTVGTSGAKLSLPHKFNGRVRWWLVGWRSSGTSAPVLKEDTSATDANTLVLLSYVGGTATIRVEESG